MNQERARIRKRWIDHGLGFPVEISNLPFIKVRGEWIPDIEYVALANGVFRSLADSPVRLTGNQIRFIRLHSEMTLQGFADRFGVTHPAVKKWEEMGNAPTKMSWGTEKDIRLFVLERSKVSPRVFRQKYQQLERKATAQRRKIRYDAQLGCTV